MNKHLRVLVLCLSGFVLLSLPANAQTLLEGRVLDPAGSAIAGAELVLSNCVVKTESHATTGSDGKYRFAPAYGLLGQLAGCRIRISHPRFQTLRVDDILTDARLTTPDARSFSPDQSPALAAATRILPRDFVLSQPQTAGPLRVIIDPNEAEHRYQQALLLLSRDRKEAV